MNGLHSARLKPNPAGKDRSRHAVDPWQLAGEWVDIKNGGDWVLPLEGLELYHLAYPRGGGEPGWEKVCGLTGSLAPGRVLRLHSGRSIPVSSLATQDQLGADFHAFTGRDAYIWNNAEGDRSGLWRPSAESWVDRASYDPDPPEGVVLERVGDKLLPMAARARGY